MLTEKQLVEWEEYNKLEPIGSYKQDFHFANLCHLIVELAQSVWGGKKRRITTIMDYMPHWFTQYKHRTGTASVRREPWQDIKGKLMAMVASQKKREK